MIVKVTDEYIGKGRRSKTRFCPIALILKAHGFKGVAVYNETAYYESAEGKVCSFRLSKSVREFVQRFDTKRDVHPFTFTIPKSVCLLARAPDQPRGTIKV